jgi:GNAT superfamily N-acetyltransferase
LRKKTQVHSIGPQPISFAIEPLNKKHDRSVFSCGVEALDAYLKKQASQDVDRHVAACFILTPDGLTVSGFYTLSQYCIDLAALPEALVRKLPKYPEVPATLLGRLAVSERFRGQKLGEFLLLDALNRSWIHSAKIASAAVVVDVKDDTVRIFYERYGFKSLPSTRDRLFLPMRTIADLFRSK